MELARPFLTLYTGRWLARVGRSVTLIDLDPQRGLWDIAALLGRPDGVFTPSAAPCIPDAAIPSHIAPATYTLVDTPPALDGSLPALNQADYLVVPVIPEAQEVAQLAKFLDMLDATRTSRPFTEMLGILPVRYIRHWSEHRAVLEDIRALAAEFNWRTLGAGAVFARRQSLQPGGRTLASGRRSPDRTRVPRGQPCRLGRARSSSAAGHFVLMLWFR